MTRKQEAGQRFLPGMSPGLVRVAEAAQRNPGGLRSLAHHIDVDALRRAFHRIRAKAAVGVDGITKEEYGSNLERNLLDLHQRLKSMRYRHQVIRRVHIDKEGGKTRPIGISTVEDKIVQDSLRELLEAIYEQDFLNCSYGFRPGRSAHDALQALNGAVRRGEVNVVLEADIVSFFDRIDRTKLKQLLEQRLADKSLMRLIGKCLHVGVLDDGVETSPELGTVQGSTLSPLLANVYLHHALDVWFETDIKPALRGKAILVRYADDFIIGLERPEEAEHVLSLLSQRLAAFGLELHPGKSRLVDFRRPSERQSRGKGPGTFDLLGFTHYWRCSRRGRWYMATKTSRSRQRRAITAVYDWCRRHRHQSVPAQHDALRRKLNGHYNYFNVRGNSGAIGRLAFHARRAWFKWLRRRSQRSRLNWDRFNDLLRDFPLSAPKVGKSLWAPS
ncbi:MAG: group II intron reverse transcriptase/maturase [Acidimicrobiia bacterium]